LQAGVPVRIAMLPDELDPAELLSDPHNREAGRAQFEQVLGQARADIDHLLRSLAPRPYELDNRARLAIVDQLLTAVRPMPDPELRALHLRDMATWMSVDAARLESRLAADAKEQAKDQAMEEDEAETHNKITPLSDRLELLCHILIQRPDLRAEATDQHGIEPHDFPEPWREIASYLFHHHDADIHALTVLEVMHNHPEVRAAVYGWHTQSLHERNSSIVDARESLNEIVRAMRISTLQEDIKRLTFEIHEAERARDFSAASERSREKLDVQRRLKDLLGR
jgi:DNA primase